MSETALTLHNASACIVLSRADETDRLGFWVRAEFTVEGLTGVVDDVLDDGEKLLRDLKKMHADMSGKATLAGIGGKPELRIDFTVRPNGALVADVAITRFAYQLKYSIDLDQSYLPQIIRAVESFR